jgi:hypothetical protein
MKGNNELRLNEATMIEAMQLWMDSQFKGSAPRVTVVEECKSGAYCKEFVVKVTDEPKVEP